jgi:hypothetical protein
MTEGSYTPCFRAVAHGKIGTLGNAVEHKIVITLHSTTRCPQMKFTIVLTIGMRGTVGASAAKRCIDPLADVKTLPFTVTGGTGAFAGAAGGGTITVRSRGPGYGIEDETWNGNLTLPK